MKVTPTSFVTIDFFIRTVDEEFPSPSGNPEEISFCLGYGLMPSALEEAMVGMVPNERRTVRLSPAQAFGEVNQDLIMELDRADFDPNLDIRPGDLFETVDEEGHPVYFLVKALRPDTVVADFNHPLAGKEVEFQITLKEVREATPEDAQQCICCHCGETHSREH